MLIANERKRKEMEDDPFPEDLNKESPETTVPKPVAVAANAPAPAADAPARPLTAASAVSTSKIETQSHPLRAYT